MNEFLENNTRYKQLCDRVRETPLIERLEKCKEMIGTMCSEGRPPRMTIPVSWWDEDFYINRTIEDAIRALKQAQPGAEVDHE